MAKARSIAILAALYFVAAKLGLRLAVVHPYATAVWPPTGIALAALLTYGRGLWPGVALGAFLANLTTGDLSAAGALVAAGIAAGNTLEAVLGAVLVERYAGGRHAFYRASDVFRFAGLGAIASTLVSAAIGVVTLCVAGLASWQDASSIGATWWIGDAGGNLIVAPALLLWTQDRRFGWNRFQFAEAALAAIAGVTLALVSFTNLATPRGPGLELAFLCTPALLWAAFRFGRREAATLLLLIYAVAIWSWMHGMFSGAFSPTYLLLELQAYMGVTSITLLAVAAEIFQRQNQRSRLVESERELRLITDDAAVCLAHFDQKARFRFVNRAYASCFGLEPLHVTGKHMAEVVGTEAFELFRPHVEAALSGRRFEAELEIPYERLGRRFMRCSYVPVNGLSGAPDGFVAVLSDITAEAKTMRALQESEERFRRIVETASEGIGITNPQGFTTFANKQMCELLGYSSEELFGRPFSDVIHPDDRERALEGFQLRKQGNTRSREYRAYRKNGTMIWLRFTGSPIHDESGKLTGILGMCTDVTERKYNEARYETLFSASQDGILIVNDQGIYVDVNQSFCDLLKTSREKLIGSPFPPFIPAARLAEAQAALQSLTETGRYEGEFPLQATDGSIIELEWRSVANFVPGLHCCVARDVSERNRFLEQMQQTQKLESLGVLAGGIAHDFNNLLVGILGNASLALDVVANQAASPMLEEVIGAGERAAKLTNQLLAYAGKQRVSTGATDVNALVSEITPLLRASIPRTVSLNLDLQEKLHCVESDQVQLQQVIMNMVINGAEAIPEGKAGSVTVTTSSRQLTAEDRAHAVIPVADREQQYVAVSFSDTGTGIAPEVQGRIFDPFFTTKFAGRGLGLSAVLGIVRSHRGALTLQSTPGTGTTFCVLLPVTQAAPAANPAERPAVPNQGSGTILVVDDEEMVRALATRALVRCGYSVITAEHGPQALDLLAAHPEIAAVLLDLTMPIMPGDQAAQHLRMKRPDLPIILSSGYPETEAVKRFAEYGLTAFLQKPYTARSLGEKIAAVLG